MIFTITSEHVKKRLDKFLKEHFPDLSRAYLQKLIEAGSVTVGGKKVPAHYFLRMGDEVEAVVEEPQELRVVGNAKIKVTPQASSRAKRSEVEGSHTPGIASASYKHGEEISPLATLGRNDGLVVEIIHEEPDFIVLNKPAGLVVHQGEGHKAPDTLVNGLFARYPEIGKVGEDPVRPGIVHRLDADVSGVMVVARTQDMFDALKRQFKMHEVEKEYVAVVHGKVSPPEGVIEFAVARKEGKMVARPRGAEGKSAVTEYEVLHNMSFPRKRESMDPRFHGDDKFSLLKIRTRTGRGHQIRVHLKAIGHPIVGDRLYGLKVEGLRIKGNEPRRLMLHARRIAFKDLTGARREFICPPKFFRNDSAGEIDL